jgi:hypothetical protein
MVIIYRRFGTTYRSNLQVSIIQNVCIGLNYLIREIDIEIYMLQSTRTLFYPTSSVSNFLLARL